MAYIYFGAMGLPLSWCAVFEGHGYAATTAAIFSITVGSGSGSGSFLTLAWRTARLQQNATPAQRDADDVSAKTTMQEKKSA